MTEKLPDVWTSRDFPVLKEVVRRLDEGDQFIMASAIAESLDMAEEKVIAAGRALRRRGLITTSGSMAAELETFDDVSGEAYIVTGLHPDGDDAVSRLIDALRQAAENTSDPDEKSRLRQVANQIGGLSREVAAGVMTAVLTGGMGG